MSRVLRQQFFLKKSYPRLLLLLQFQCLSAAAYGNCCFFVVVSSNCFCICFI